MDDKDHPATAVKTALQMLKAVNKFNDELKLKGRPPVGMGAGINTGIGYIGEMGSTKRHSYDVLGDSVSTAARIESKCKEYGCLLLVGEETVKRCDNKFFFLKVDDLAVKGKTVGVGIYTVLDKEHDTYVWDTRTYSRSKNLHDQMHELYRAQDFKGAIKLIKQLRGHFHGQMDDYYTMWEGRCEYMKTQKLPKDWNGVFVATTK
jgi:adenylate cyclase